MIRLVDLLKLQGVTLENENYKLHLATTGDGSPPLDAYLAGPLKEWQENQTDERYELALTALLELLALNVFNSQETHFC